MRETTPERCLEEAWERAQLARARAGDTQAFGELLARYQNRIFALVKRLVARPAEAQELTQEVFLQAFKSQSRFDPTRSFRPWLYRIAVNVCQNHRRHSSRREVLTPPLEHLRALWEHDPQSPEQASLCGTEKRTVVAALAQLKANERELLLLRFWQDLDYAELTQVYHLPQTVLKMRVHRALRALRALIAGGPDAT